MNKQTIISYGEVLWDLLPTGAVLGGAPCNFAYRMHTFGHQSVIVSRLGTDDYGLKAREHLTKLGLSMKGIQSDSESPTGTVHIDLDKDHNPDYYIVPDVAYDQIEPTPQLADIVLEADAICFGTLAQRSPRSRKTLYWLIEQMRPQAIKICDINLRKNCFDQQSMEHSLQQANILKLSDEETMTMADYFDLDHTNLVDMGKKIVAQWNLKCCLITLGSRGALAFGEKEEVVYQPGFEIEMKEPIGAGDACTAGFIHRYLAGESLQACCKTGCGLGALVATQSGATETVTLQSLDAFLDSSPRLQIDPRLGHLLPH